MRKYFSLLGLSLLTVLFSFTACSDDDDNKAPDSKPEEVKPDDKHSEQATALLTILDALAEVDSLPDNWNSPDFTAISSQLIHHVNGHNHWSVHFNQLHGKV